MPETNLEKANRIAQQWFNEHVAGTAVCNNAPSINAMNEALPKLGEAIAAALDQEGE